MKDFWQKLNKPFYALAPLAGITDSAFRQMCKKFGADVVYSEMVSATALFYNDKKTRELMKFNEIERPYIIQLFGAEPKHFAVAAKFITEKVKPDGIDINFGCPVRKVVKQGAGIALFADLKRSREVIKAVIGSTDLPVSIKTRSAVKMPFVDKSDVGALRAMPADAEAEQDGNNSMKPLRKFNQSFDILHFLDHMTGLDIKALMIHGRSGGQGFAGPVDHGLIKQARNHFGGIIIANGGVKDRESAIELLDNTAADGAGIGQGALGRPWVFKAVRTGQSTDRSVRPIVKIALEHAELAWKLKGRQGVVEMRKHLCWYVSGLPGAGKLRGRLVKIGSIAEIRDIFREIPD